MNMLLVPLLLAVNLPELSSFAPPVARRRFAFGLSGGEGGDAEFGKVRGGGRESL